MAFLLKRILERFFPSIAKHIRFRAIRTTSLPELQKHRLFEPELLLVPALIEGTAGACLDIGAYMGEYCSVLERCVPPNRIHAFEPNPESRTLLRRFFPKIHVWEEALSDHVGSAIMTVPSIHGKRYATRGTLEAMSMDVESSEIVTVPTTTLDAISAKIGPVSFLKIDVEGHERKVIAGGRQMILRDHPVLLIEIEERHCKCPIHEVFAEIEVLGYCALFLDLRAMRLRPISEFIVSSMQQESRMKTADYVNNFFFFPNNRCTAPESLQRLLASGAL